MNIFILMKGWQKFTKHARYDQIVMCFRKFQVLLYPQIHMYYHEELRMIARTSEQYTDRKNYSS